MNPIKNLVAIAALTVATAHAGVVIAPVTAVSDRVGLGSTATGTINQSGLSSPYVAGVTDFATYVAGTTAYGTGLSDVYIPFDADFLARLTYGFGSAKTIDSIAVWNNTLSFTGGLDAISGFDLYADSDADFSNGTSGSLGHFTMRAAVGGPTLADVFSFASTTTSFVHFQITGTQAGRRTGINELVFGAAGNPVPEPGTLALAGLGLALASSRLRRR